MSKTIKFKKGFLWGSATSGPQTEGNIDRGESIWDDWYANKKELFFNKKNVEGNLYKRYIEYVDKAAELGFNSLRTSIQWSRLIPDGKTISSSAVTFYRKYFSYMISKGITPLVCLMHFDTPLWIQKIGGFENKKSISEFTKYAKICFKEFGDIVKTWFTFNEPIVPVEAGYLNTFHPPAIVNMKKAMQVQFNLIMSHLEVVKFYKNNYKGEIGIILNITPSIPRSNSKEDIEASEWAEIFQSKVFMDSIIKGKIPNKILIDAQRNNYMWKMSDLEHKLLQENIGIDILGINYYAPMRVKAVESKKPWSNNLPPHKQYFMSYDKPGIIMNKYRGWEILPEGVYLAMKKVHEEYNNQKIFISENGMGVEGEEKQRDNTGVINDHYRIDFFTKHLLQIHRAIQEGSNCIGFHMWTYIDNWSWLNAYKNRYGFVELNLKTKKIKNKKSAMWFKNLALTGQLMI